MESKGAIKVFAILLTLVCLFQLSFTFVSSKIQKDAREEANGNAVKEKAYLDSIATETVYDLGVVDYTYREVQEKEINLGLDLKGGMNVTMEVSVVELIRAMSNFSKDQTFNQALSKAKQDQKSSQEDFVTLFGRAFQEIDPNAQLAAIFSTQDLSDRVTYNATNEEVLAVIREEADNAISRTFNILRTRIDKFGVTQPNIQRLGSGRILIELPGVKDPERVETLLQGTAKLEFWETYENSELFQYLSDINEILAEEKTLDSLVGSKSDTGNVAETIAETIDTAASAIDTSAQDGLGLLDQINTDTDDSDTSGASEFAKFSQENPLFAVLTPAIFTNEQQQQEFRKGPVIGYALIKDTGKVNRYLAKKGVKGILPRDVKFLWSVKPPVEDSPVLELIAIKTPRRGDRAPLEGDKVSDARKDYGQFDGRPEISMRMNPEGAKLWRRITSENIGRSVAIVLDNYVYSYPTVQSEIAGGSSQITGNFTDNEAKDLANILKAGKLPAPAHIVEKDIVGPSLGEESIRAGLLSLIISLVIVLFYMIFYYGNAGIAADLALFANIFFVMGVLASLSAVLTLPGIAGIVLTIGMSVDANVLIYERIREELAAGKGLKLAISDGYKAAYSSIIDANVTTLLTGVILFIFGSGPIQGFATTLIIGILTSLFSAIFLTRLVFEWRLSKNHKISFASKTTANAFRNMNWNFVGKRKVYYTISSIIIIAGIVSMFARGFDFGVDFRGGRTYTVEFNEDRSTTDVRNTLTGAFGSAPIVKTSSVNNRMKITTTYLIDSDELDADEKVKAALMSGLGIEKDQVIRSQKVGPTIADDIKTGALYAIIFSLIVIFIYILLRFRKWTYGLGALVALLHDVMVIMGLFSIFWGILPFSMEIDQAFIAAILTCVGYSINDTVVVFDRIREFLGIHKKKDMTEVVNHALNSTISRTFNTSITVFFVILAIFLFGGDVIRGFSFALLIGVLVGTYSSVCIASPIVLDFAKRQLPDASNNGVRRK